jgi:hypothetical protein
MSRRAVIGAEPRIAAQPSEEGLSVGQLMSAARASLLNSLDAELERFGLNSTHFLVLKHLGGRHDAHPGPARGEGSGAPGARP